MKAKQEPAQRGPLAGAGGRTRTWRHVPLEEVLRRLRVSEREAGAVKKGLLAEVTRLTDGPAAPARPK